MYNMKCALSMKLIKLVTDGILLAMEYLSSKNITHNFMNSTSVYINRGFLPKLGNFEYAFSRHGGEHVTQRKYTLAAEEFHFPYMAPELHRDEKWIADNSSDMYRYVLQYINAIAIFRYSFGSTSVYQKIPLNMMIHLTLPAKKTSLHYYFAFVSKFTSCLLYTSPSPRDGLLSRMPSSA